MLRKDIDAISFVPLGTKTSITWDQSLAVTYTDGILVMHRGKVVYERYFGVLKPAGQHAAMSVTKSVIGTLGAMLVAKGQIDANKLVADYVPEPASSAFGSATVRQVLDMTTGLKYSEDYVDPKAEMVIVRYASHSVSSNSANDPVTLPAFDALARHLSRLP